MVYFIQSSNGDEYNKWLEECTENEEMPFFNKRTNFYDFHQRIVKLF